MILEKWKFYQSEKDFYYYRSNNSLMIKVYPIFSFCLINGPKDIIYWNLQINEETVKSKNSLELMLYADMKLSEEGYSLELPFSPITSDEDDAMKNINKYFKLNSIHFGQK